MSRGITRRALLAGAAAGVAAASVAAPRLRAAGPVELRMSWWGGSDVHKAQLSVLRRFEERNPNIRVRAEYTGWTGHLERLTTQIAGDTAPDLMQLNWNWLVLFSLDGRGFYDLHELSKDVDLEPFGADALGFGTMAGKLNALPITMAARLFYYNATTYERAGLALPRSWDDLFAAGPIFRERLGPGYYPLQLALQEVVAIGRTWLLQRSGKPMVDEQSRQLNASESDLQEIAALYQRLVDEHVIPSVPEFLSYGNVPAQELRPWIDGHYAGAHQWISAIGKVVDTLAPGQRAGLGEFPLRSGAVDAGLLYRPAMLYAVNAKSKHPHEAAALMNFVLHDAEAVRVMAMKRGPPVSSSALQTLAGDGTLTGIAWQGTQQVAKLPNHIRESGFFEHPRVRDAFIDVFELLGYRRLDPRAAGSRMFEDLNQILKRVIRT